MRKAFCLALVGTGLLAGCSSAPLDPIRVVDSPVDVYGCRPLGRLGEPVRTDGQGPALAGLPANTTLIPLGGIAGYGSGPLDGNFGLRLDAMKAAALQRGATHLLLSRRILRDWSYVEGTAYRCRA